MDKYILTKEGSYLDGGYGKILESAGSFEEVIDLLLTNGHLNPEESLNVKSSFIEDEKKIWHIGVLTPIEEEDIEGLVEDDMEYFVVTKV